MANTIEDATEFLRKLQSKIDKPMNAATEIFWAEVLVDYAGQAFDLADVVKSCEHDYQSYCQGFQFKCSKCGDTYGAC